MMPSPARTWETLSPRERQVLRFVATFEESEGFLPTTRLVASECGLRSASSAARILRVLETDGFIERDADNRGLGRVSVPGPTTPPTHPDDELLLAMATLFEFELALARDHVALAWCPARAAQVFVHQCALRRLELMQLYDAAVERLHERGAVVTARGRFALDRYRQLARRKHELVDSWDKYCLVFSIIEPVLRDYLEGPRQMRRVHLQAAYETELLQRLPSHPDVERDWSDGALDDSLRAFRSEYVDLLVQTAGAIMSALHPSLSSELPVF